MEYKLEATEATIDDMMALLQGKESMEKIDRAILAIDVFKRNPVSACHPDLIEFLKDLRGGLVDV